MRVSLVEYNTQSVCIIPSQCVYYPDHTFHDRIVLSSANNNVGDVWCIGDYDQKEIWASMVVVDAKPDVTYATRQNGEDLHAGQWLLFSFLNRRADTKIDDMTLGPDMVYKVEWKTDPEDDYPEKMEDTERFVIHCDVQL